MSLPKSRKLWRVTYPYFTEGDEWKTTQSVLLDEETANAEALVYNERVLGAAARAAGKRAVVIVDRKAVDEYEKEKEDKRAFRTKRTAS